MLDFAEYNLFVFVLYTSSAIMCQVAAHKSKLLLPFFFLKYFFLY